MALGRTLTSLAVVTALAGSPALLSVCLAGCLPAAADAVAPAAPHDAVSPAGAHAHHGGAAGPVASTLATAPFSGGHEAARLDGECHDCCASAADALDAGLAAERPAGVASTLTIGAGVGHLSPVTLLPTRQPLPPPVSPPAPVRASLVLRI